MSSRIVRTFWIHERLHCVLVNDGDDTFAVQVFIGDQPFVTDPIGKPQDATERADALFHIFCPDPDTPATSAAGPRA